MLFFSVQSILSKILAVINWSQILSCRFFIERGPTDFQEEARTNLADAKGTEIKFLVGLSASGVSKASEESQRSKSIVCGFSRTFTDVISVIHSAVPLQKFLIYYNVRLRLK